MYTTSFQGMYPAVPANVRSSHLNSHYGPYSMYQGHYGYHPYSYPNYGNVGNFQSSMNPNYGHLIPYQPKVKTHNTQQVKAKPINKTQHQKIKSPIKHHQYHWHHGFPYGQGSGLFPDYYQSNY
ncbi:hypothetical protein [Alkalihalobacterium chitinilyticum]|uniref:Spore coat protein n=1 Tax=Alkalihalobacterium chitinilyticum TaxID=2980103 RepID=A0ABT5V8I6_9BACI|nr:hypothetical protein [Alkalihalobacterium chitinilyticum]MDE5411773.1 hypothetical protein [Alkalihalobacterium chitinilyticum]